MGLFGVGLEKLVLVIGIVHTHSEMW
jgi:hypothetical protein